MNDTSALLANSEFDIDETLIIENQERDMKLILNKAELNKRGCSVCFAPEHNIQTCLLRRQQLEKKATAAKALAEETINSVRSHSSNSTQSSDDEDVAECASSGIFEQVQYVFPSNTFSVKIFDIVFFYFVLSYLFK
jgi:hypothetical protein